MADEKWPEGNGRRKAVDRKWTPKIGERKWQIKWTSAVPGKKIRKIPCSREVLSAIARPGVFEVYEQALGKRHIKSEVRRKALLRVSLPAFLGEAGWKTSLDRTVNYRSSPVKLVSLQFYGILLSVGRPWHRE